MAFQYELYVPKKDNEGHAYCPIVLEKYKLDLIRKFGDHTRLWSECEGVLKDGKLHYENETAIWAIIADGEPEEKNFLEDFKNKIEQDLHNENIKLREQPVPPVYTIRDASRVQLSQ